MNLLLDGNVLTSASVYTNEKQSHKSLVPVFFYTCSIKAGSHAFTVEKGANAEVGTKRLLYYYCHRILSRLAVTGRAGLLGGRSWASLLLYGVGTAMSKTNGYRRRT